MNRLTIAGTVEKTVSPIGNSDKVGEFLIKVPDRRKTASGNWEDSATFFPVKVFGKALGVARAHLSTGSRCFVTGKLEGREYNGKYYTSVVAEEVFPVVGGEARQAQPGSHEAPHQVGQPSWTEDDIPF